MRLCASTFCLMLLAFVAGNAQGHGGGLDRHGCHNDHRNGGYHCHRGPAVAAPARVAPQRTPPGNAEFNPGTSPATGAYRNCSEARAAGAAPVRRGDPGYGPHLDRDNDGIGCEPYRGR